MKLSVAWIFDYINADWRKQDINKLVDLFNQNTAEIEAYYPVTLADDLLLGTIVSVAHETVELQVDGNKALVELPKLANMQIKQQFLLKRKGTAWRFATGKDFGSDKVVELPPVYVQDTSAFNAPMDVHDYILEVDNKSITHRPDLWSHYGFAREVAILLNLPFKEFHYTHQLPIHCFASESKVQDGMPYVVRIEQPDYVKRFACVYFDKIETRSSIPWMLSRLCRIDAKPINALVDLTNYVMFDIGQPMHAFDAQKFETKRINIGFARAQESLNLLDGESITLTKDDLVVSDGKTAVALAGIMGGKETAVSSTTTSILLESANFDATKVRLSSAQHKKRTESSARFEKTVDPNQNSMGIERFIALLEKEHIAYHAACVINVGPELHPLTIEISHAYIQDRLGAAIDSHIVMDISKKLGFSVTTKTREHDTIYSVTVPTRRSTKDIKIKEDLLEEIGRLYGYTKIPFCLPLKETKPFSLHDLNQERALKRQLSFGFQMHEVKNYAFYNETFLHELRWYPTDAVSVPNPVSEQYQRLVTSLVPGLLANVKDNCAEYDTLRFFEWARVWHNDGEITESAELSALFYDKKDAISFYDIKAYVQTLCEMIQLPVSWHKVNTPEEPWFAPYQTARVMYQNKVVATVGLMNVAYTHHVVPGNMALFSLDALFFKSYKPVVNTFVPLPKYPAVTRDVSMMVPLDMTVERITKTMLGANSLIKEVTLIDFFEKEEWIDQKSVSFRYIMRDETKTLTHQEADLIVNQVVTALQSVGAVIR